MPAEPQRGYQADDALGISRPSFYKKLHMYGLFEKTEIALFPPLC